MTNNAFLFHLHGSLHLTTMFNRYSVWLWPALPTEVFQSYSGRISLKKKKKKKTSVKNLGCFLFQATVREASTYNLQSKTKSVMLAQPRAQTHIKMILRCISKLCQLRRTSNKALARHGSDITDHNYDALSTQYELIKEVLFCWIVLFTNLQIRYDKSANVSCIS